MSADYVLKKEPTAFLGAPAKAGEAFRPGRPPPRGRRVCAGQKGGTGTGLQALHCAWRASLWDLEVGMNSRVTLLTGVPHGGLPAGGAVCTSPCRVLQTTWDLPLGVPALGGRGCTCSERVLPGCRLLLPSWLSHAPPRCKEKKHPRRLRETERMDQEVSSRVRPEGEEDLAVPRTGAEWWPRVAAGRRGLTPSSRPLFGKS